MKAGGGCAKDDTTLAALNSKSQERGHRACVDGDEACRVMQESDSCRHVLKEMRWSRWCRGRADSVLRVACTKDMLGCVGLWASECAISLSQYTQYAILLFPGP